MGAALSRVLRPAGGAFGLAAVIALGLLPTPTVTFATSFNPNLSVSLSNPAPDSVTDLEITFSIDAPDANFDTIVTFIPPEFFMATDAQVVDGAMVGFLDATSTLGLLNGQCNTRLPVTFELMDATTDIERPYPLYAGYNDYDGDGLPENVTHYPDFLLRAAPDLQPRQRMYGQTLVAGVQTFINFVVFEPGALIPLIPALDPALGYPTMVFLNDPTQPSVPFAITDFCTPVAAETTMFGTSQDNPQIGEGGGAVLRRTPANAGDYNSVSFVRSQWDADNDGWENPLDPCSLTPNPGWDPRANGYLGDSDGDGLPNVCDPSSQAIPDQDGDGYLNRQDNCPLIINNYPIDSDHDLIGDACDPAPNDPTNGGSAHQHEVCVRDTFVVGTNGSPAPDVACPTGPNVPIPLTLGLHPGDAVRPIGNVQPVSVDIRQPGTYQGIPGVLINIDVTGANPTSGSCTTQQGGGCEFSYLGLNVGTDTIVVTAHAPGQTITKTTTITWLLPPANDLFANGEDITLFPAAVTAEIPAASSVSGEPGQCGYVDHTVWYDLTSDTDRYVRIEAGASGMYAYLALYANQAVGGFRAVACGYHYFEASEDAGESYLFAHLPAGQTLHLQVSGGPFGQFIPTDLTVDIQDAVEGDTDCDGDRDMEDIMGILISIGAEEPADCYGAGDWDCNGRASPRDVTGALSHMAGVGPALKDCPWDYYSGPFD